MKKRTGPPRKFFIEKDELHDLYQRYSAREIAKQKGVGETVVWNRIKEYGIALGGFPGGHRKKTGRIFTKEHRENLSKAKRGKYVGARNPNWKGGDTHSVCGVCDQVFSHKKADERKFCSAKCYRIYEKYSQVGQGNKNWCGGVDRQRPNTSQAKQWRKEALLRAEYCCEECGISGIDACSCCGQTPDLHVHHVQSWREFPELRFDIENARVLCTSCHRAVHREKTA